MVILRGERAGYKDIAPPWVVYKIKEACEVLNKGGSHAPPELGGASTTCIALSPRRGGKTLDVDPLLSSVPKKSGPA
jgi:hypothetical protein